MEEVWKRIVSYKGVSGYEISSLMRVRDDCRVILKVSERGTVRLRSSYGSRSEYLNTSVAHIFAKDFLGYKKPLRPITKYNMKPCDVIDMVNESIKTFQRQASKRTTNGIHRHGRDGIILVHDGVVVNCLFKEQGVAMDTYMDSFIRKDEEVSHVRKK